VEELDFKVIKPYLGNFETIDCLLRDTHSENYWICKRGDGELCEPTECPLCSEADLTDLKQYDIDLFNEYLQDVIMAGYREEQFSNTDEWIGPLSSITDCPWVVVSMEVKND
jgi:hypothetical protein